MHIAIDARIINSSTGRYVERLLHYLQHIDKTNQYTVLVTKKDEKFWKPTNKNFKTKIADFAQYSFAEQIGFKKLLDDLKPDLVHFCMPQQPILYSGRHVTTFHDMTLVKVIMPDKNLLVYKTKQIIGKFVFRRVARTSSHIIVPSQFTQDELVAFTGIPADKVTVTLLAADKTDGQLKLYDHPFKQYIMYVGQQADYKNIKRLGDAHQQLLTKYPDLGLILVGRKDKTAAMNEKYFNNSGYKNILFTDFIPDSQRDWLYKNTGAYIFPSLMEGFGLPGLEAMTYGAPVVSSNATCLPEVYGKAANYFEPSDVGDIARAIDEVLSSKTRRNELIELGYEQVKKYSWKRTAEQTYAIYLDALNK